MKILTVLCVFVLSLANICRAAFGTELKVYSFGTADIVRDDVRDRVYCAVPAQNSVVVIDSESLQILATIFTGSQPNGLSVSADGTKLYVANQGSTTQGIAVIDLATLTITQHIATTQAPRDVAVGNGTLYTLESSSIRAYNASTGALLSGALSSSQGGIFVYGGALEISPDGNTLYFFQTGLSPSSWFRINVTSWPGAKLQEGQFGSNGQAMTLSADGQFITFASGSPYYINKLQASNPTVSLGQMDTGAFPRAAAYSPDGNYLFAVHTSGHIDVWNANTFVQLPQISTVGEPRVLKCDRRGKVFFAGTTTELRAYYIGTDNVDAPLNLAINPAVEIRWDSVAGSLYQVEWRSQLGGNATWYSLGGPILGNGLTMSVFDTTRGNQAKFFRVTKLSP